MSRSADTPGGGTPRAVVVGAGLAGLAAAVRLAARGARVVVLEATAAAGGRCRSYEDAKLGLVIDNGNHLVMSGNASVAEYVRLLGVEDRLRGPKAAAFDFVDLETEERWCVRPNASPLPYWVLSARRRPPEVTLREFLGMVPLLAPRPGARVDETVDCSGALWRRMMEPFLLAALNTRAEEGDAALAAAVLKGTLARGGDAYRPRIAEPNLAAAFVEPALSFLEARGAEIRFGARVRDLETRDGKVTALGLSGETLSLEPGDQVILATPSWIATELLPGLDAPDEFRAILNAHFRTTPPADAPRMLGVVGGLVEWIFAFDDRIGVTISNADRLMDLSRDELAPQIWSEVVQALGLLPEPLPPWQIVKEKRATFAATVAQNRRRPGQTTPYANLRLAGDWVATGLPATIEGAILSGFRAADLSEKALGV